MNGVEAVFDKVNSEGGVHGRNVVLVREDDNCKPEGAIAAVKKLVYDQKVFAIIGGACSNATLASVPEIKKSGIPMVVNSAVADGITDPPKTNIYTTQLTSGVESRAQIDFALARGAEEDRARADDRRVGDGPLQPARRVCRGEGDRVRREPRARGRRQRRHPPGPQAQGRGGSTRSS